MSRPALRIAALTFALLLAGLPAAAHEGHDHGAPEPPVTDPRLVVRAASNADYEAVIKYRTAGGERGAVVRVYLNDYATNQPLDGARVALRTTHPAEVRAEAAAMAPGVYEAALRFERSGRYALILAVAGPVPAEFAFDDLPLGEEPAPAAAAARPAGRRSLPWLALGGGLLAVILVGFGVARRRRVAPGAAGLLLLGTLVPASPVTAADPAAGAAAQLRHMPKESQFLLGVRTLVARPERLRSRLTAVGHVVAASGALARVVAPRDGRLEPAGRRLAVGDRVARGERLADLLVIDRLPIRAPIPGLVAEVHATPGQWVQAGAPLFVILDEREVGVELPLFGADLNRALRARDATVTAAAIPGHEFRGRVRGLAPLAPESGTAAGAEGHGPVPPVLLTVANRGGLLRPGMLVEAGLELPEAGDVVALPESAVLRLETGAVVFLHVAPEIFEQRAVRIEGRYGTRIGVAGVSSGDRVVTAGAAAVAAAPPLAPRTPARSAP